MLDFLKDHPFTVEAFFDSSLVVTFAVNARSLGALIPNCLSIDELRGHGFIAVAMVQTRGLRPAGWPRLFGQDFFLIGYRVFVRFQTDGGRSMRGLYILRSATNKRRMQYSGNLFTRYSYRTVDVTQGAIGDVRTINSLDSNLHIRYRQPSGPAIGLPANSPFENLQEARKFAGPLPYTFTVEKTENRVLVIEGVRRNWRPEAVQIVDANVGFLDEIGFPDAQLANAFLVTNIPYRWEKGRFQKCPKPS